MINYDDPITYDNPGYNFEGFFFYSQTLSETITNTESISKSFARTISETISSTENLMKSFFKTVSETVSIAENYSRIATFGRVLLENIISSELLGKLQNGTSTIWSQITNVATSWTERSPVSSIWTPRTTQSFLDYDSLITYDLETRTYNGNVPFDNRTKPTTSFTNRTKPTSSWTNRIKP